MTETEHIKSDIIKYHKFADYFKQKELGDYLDSFILNQSDKIIEDLNNSYEKGDIKNCNEIIKRRASISKHATS